MSAKTWAWMSLCGLLLAIGCDARTLIGQVPDGSAPDGSATGGSNQPSLDPVGTSGHTCAPPQFTGDHPFDLPAGTEGVWTGYVEGVNVGVSSDAIRLTLDHATDGTSQIHLVLGVKAPPPPATSATESYPPGTDTGAGGGSGQIEGFSYAAHNVNWQAFGQQWRLRFMINTAEPYGSWCRLQSSYATPYPGGVEYGCLPNTGGGSMPSPGVDGGQVCYLSDNQGNPIKTVSCAQLYMCPGNYLCGCDECGCDQQGISYDGIPSGPGTYDILFDGTSASGSGVHLMRAAN